MKNDDQNIVESVISLGKVLGNFSNALNVNTKALVAHTNALLENTEEQRKLREALPFARKMINKTVEIQQIKRDEKETAESIRLGNQKNSNKLENWNNRRAS